MIWTGRFRACVRLAPACVSYRTLSRHQEQLLCIIEREECNEEQYRRSQWDRFCLWPPRTHFRHHDSMASAQNGPKSSFLLSNLASFMICRENRRPRQVRLHSPRGHVYLVGYFAVTVLRIFFIKKSCTKKHPRSIYIYQTT